MILELIPVVGLDYALLLNGIDIEIYKNVTVKA